MNVACTITNADDQRLISLITRAQQRVAFLAPGVSQGVADALVEAWRRLGRDACTVILDVDPEVCRLGYGTFDALTRLGEAAAKMGSLLCHQSGLRIGLLIADDRTVVFSPTPLLIEAGSDAPCRPNAIEIGPPPEDVARDLGFGPAGIQDRRIGLDPVEPRRVESVKRDLEAAPPLKFDLARRVRVFNSRFQFVELEMTGCFISHKTVPIPSAFVGLGQKEVENQFKAHYSLVKSGVLHVKADGEDITERKLLDHRRDIRKRFLISLPSYGTVVLRANKDKLIKAVDELREKVASYSQGIRAQLDDMISRACATVVEALLPAVERNPPDQYTKTLGPTPSSEALRKMLEEDISRAFGKAEALVNDMDVTLVFKDVAYESLVDEKFIETARKAMPHVEFLHEEYEAAAGDPEGTGS